MKLQYLGDSKDSFKWDYHDYLISVLDYPTFNIVPMLTPDDESNEGKSHPSLFPARKEIIDFCLDLREYRSIEAIKFLPSKTGASYKVVFHNADTYLTSKNRVEYFSGFSNSGKQFVFIDPDIGFEPEKSYSDKHLRYSEANEVLKQVSNESVVSVFQYHRRISFLNDFTRIRERIKLGYMTAIYWHSLMFVAISKSNKAIKRVIKTNKKYSENNPVKIIV